MAEPSMSKGVAEDATYKGSASSEELDAKVDSDADSGESVTATDNSTGNEEAKTAKKFTRKRRKVLVCRTASEHSRAVDLVVRNEDLLTKILLLVSVKSLLKFKSVSKRWHSIISDTQFASNHACRNLSSSFISGLYLYHRPWFNLELKSVSFDGRMSLPTLAFLDSVREVSESRIVDSCNGLLLFSNGDKIRYIVCNPTTQKYIELSKSCGITSSKSCQQFGAYLAFDPSKSPYYKVVLIGYHYAYDGKPPIYLIDIYSSKIGSWKVMQVEAPQGNSYSHRVFWNGAIHWMSNSNVHIRFDVDAENLTGTPMPKVPNILEEDKCLYFEECGGNLLLIQTRKHAAMRFRILEMEKGSFRWIVKCQVDLRHIRSIIPQLQENRRVHTVLCCANGANEKDFALVLAIPGKIIAYNLNWKTMKVLDLLGDNYKPSGYCYKYTYQFIESLFPL